MVSYINLSHRIISITWLHLQDDLNEHCYYYYSMGHMIQYEDADMTRMRSAAIIIVSSTSIQ
jgi:hypothetical protein